MLRSPMAHGSRWLTCGARVAANIRRLRAFRSLSRKLLRPWWPYPLPADPFQMTPQQRRMSRLPFRRKSTRHPGELGPPALPQPATTQSMIALWPTTRTAKSLEAHVTMAGHFLQRLHDQVLESTQSATYVRMALLAGCMLSQQHKNSPDASRVARCSTSQGPAAAPTGSKAPDEAQQQRLKAMQDRLKAWQEQQQQQTK